MQKIGFAVAAIAALGFTQVARAERTGAFLYASFDPNVIYNDVAGQMSSFVFAGSRSGHLHGNGDGTWRVVPVNPITERYSWLDLYLMGLAPPGKVKPVHRLIQPDYSDPDRVTAGQVETWSIQELLDEAGGPRIPAAKDSAKNFKIAFMMVKNKSFTQAELAWMSLVAKYFTSREKGEHYLTPFYTATYKRGTLDPQLPLPDRGSTNR
ncbi:MAG: hypothetical protein AB1714_07790 [Acidobacteriota bacterium]